MHEGIDIPYVEGAPVRVTAPGIVTFAGWAGGYGNMVEVAHGGGVVTRYAHLSRIYVVQSAAVRLGESIGQVGSTGSATGPHLHYEVRINGKAVDPLSGRIVFGPRGPVNTPSPWLPVAEPTVAGRQEWSDPQHDGMLLHSSIK